MNGLEYDTSQTGLNTILKDWQLKVMQVVWNSPEGANSRAVHQKVNEMLTGETISRASVINFLEEWRERGVFSGKEQTGKGGYHWVYYPKMDEMGFIRYIVETIIDSLVKNYPDETKETIKQMKK
jgi:predicted transcriptional regulator